MLQPQTNSHLKIQRLAHEALETTSFPVIVFGAGVVGQLLVHALQIRGVVVACFADNSTAKAGTKLSGLDVLPAMQLRERYSEAIFVIATADIQDIVDQLNHDGFHCWIAGSDILRESDFASFPIDAPPGFIEFAAEACLQCQDAYLSPGKLFFRSIDIIITERCSLKCRDCSNLMQYYEHPVNVSNDEIINSIDAICELGTEIHEFRIIGGEPFMNKSYPAIVQHLIKKSNVKRIVIYTNATIVPNSDQLASLRHEKVMLLITDYGPLSPRSAALTEALDRNNVEYFLRKADGWSECGSIKHYQRSKEQLQTLFSKCCAKNLYTISAGKLHRCPFSANAARLGAIADYPNDYVTLDGNGSNDLNEIRNKIVQLKNTTFLSACDYCTGRPLDAPTIQPALQTDKPLAYVRFLEK